MLGSRYVLPSDRSTVHVAFTDRHGGYSGAEHASFNLGAHVDDDPVQVQANRALLASAIGLNTDRLAFMNQVHGTTVVDVDLPADGRVPEADAQITARLGVGLVVLVADCTPIVLADPSAGLVAAVHCGRKGMTAGVVDATVARMRAGGAEDLHAWIGPSVCPRCYEVPADLRAEVAARVPVAASVSRTGTPALDVAAGAAEQLGAAGVRIEAWDRTCTAESEHLYSYRRSARTGRFAGVVWMQSSES